MKVKKKDIIKLLFCTVIVHAGFSCNNHSQNVNQNDATNKVKTSGSPTEKFLTVKGDSVRISINHHVITFPKTAVKNYQNAYMGIYTVHSGIISRTGCLQTNNLIFFTTYSDLSTGNRGYLYAFDLIQKKFLIGDSKKNYLFSYAGIFFLDKGKVYNIYRPYFDEHYNSFVITADVYQVNNSFQYIKYIIGKGDFLDEKDYRSLIDFYNKKIR
jgi:hypothetical protein